MISYDRINYDKDPQAFRHKAIQLEHEKQKIWIDELLAPIILSCWKKGIRTVACCQEPVPGISFIAFLEDSDVEKFLKPISSLTFDRTDFDRINQSQGKWVDRLEVYRQVGMVNRPHLVRGDYELGYKGLDLPVWTKNSSLEFPISYIPAFEKALFYSEP
jgi:hypothetical protein